MTNKRGPAPAFALGSRVNAPRSWWLETESRQAFHEAALRERARMAANPHKGTGGEKRIVGSGKAITGAR